VFRSMIEKLKQQLAEESERLPLFIPVIFAFGIIFGVHFPFSSFVRLFAFTFGCTLFAIISPSLIKYIVIIFSCGVWVSQTGGILCFDLISLSERLEEDVPKVRFVARVDFIEETHPTMHSMQRIILKNIIFDDKKNLDFLKTVKMTCHKSMLSEIKPADTVVVFGNLNKFSIPAVPGGFDQLQYNTIIGINANGIVFSIKKVDSPNELGFSDIFSHLRFRIVKYILTKIKGDAGGVAAALLTGDKSAIRTEIREQFIKSGTAHILAISGLHMSLVAGILLFVLKRMALYLSCLFWKINASSLAAIIVIPMSFLYLALSGFSPSATRAFIMVTICLTSVIMKKQAISLRNIALAALIIMLFSPFSIFHVSFQLSFAAVVALVSAYEKFRFHFFKNKILSYIFASTTTTIIATAATTPISIATFNRFSAQNVLGNLFSIPITSFLVIPFGLTNVILNKFTTIFLWPLELSINLLIKFVSIVSDLPGSDLTLKTPTMPIMYMVILGSLLLCLLQTKIRHLGSVLILTAIFLYIFHQKVPHIILVPGTDNIICVIENDKFFANTRRKGRNRINDIMRTFGFNDKINLLGSDFKINAPQYDKRRGLFIFNSGEMRQLSIRKHPVCPASFVDFKSR
jgi:competence protein ComEC